jgi:hypothetical protein
MSKVFDVLMNDLIAECDRNIAKWQSSMDKANDEYERGLYQGKIESYKDMKHSLLKRKSELG